MHLLVIGQNYSVMRTTDPREVPLHKKLCEWFDQVGIRHYSFVNAQQREGKYAPTLEDTDFLYNCIFFHRGPILVLGWNAWRTMYQLYGTKRALAMLGPHPSGLNRNLNDPQFERKFIGTLIGYMSRKDLDNAIYRT